MYLEYFKFKEMPFGLTPHTGFFCPLKGHEEALNVLLFSLRSGEGFIKIIGEVGSGKTLLCRKLLDALDTDFVTAYIPNPDLNPIELRRAFARELGINPSPNQDQHELITLMYNRLIALHNQGKRVVLLLDEAQALPKKTFEALRLLTNFETEKNKLVQVVLFGQPELNDLLAKSSFRQLEQRITFSYFLPLLSREDLDTYLFHRLAKAGLNSGSVFMKKTRDILYKSSRGVPRIVNILCHKALLLAYGRGEKQITPQIMRLAIIDTEFVTFSPQRFYINIFLGVSIFIAAIVVFYWYKGII